MAIQKKSLISSLNTTKKAIVASSTPAENPSVSSPVKTQIRDAALTQVRHPLRTQVRQPLQTQVKAPLKTQVTSY